MGLLVYIKQRASLSERIVGKKYSNWFEGQYNIETMISQNYFERHTDTHMKGEPKRLICWEAGEERFSRGSSDVGLI